LLSGRFAALETSGGFPLDPVDTRHGLQKRFDDLRKKHETIIAQRDRRIAHNDHAVMSGATRLLTPLKGQIGEAISDLCALMNQIGARASRAAFPSSRILIRVAASPF
jgi:hypothetical protein